MQKFYRNVFAAGVFALGLAACGDDVVLTEPTNPPAPAVQSVTVAPATQTLSINQEVSFSASVNADAGLATTVTWVSNNTSIATVDANGKVKGIAPGTTTIVATSTVDAGKTGIATVTVVPNPPGIVSFNPSVANVTLSVGGTGVGQVIIETLTGVANPPITWQSLNTSVVTVGTVTQTATGSNVVLTGVAPGTAVVRATATVGDQTVHANINVTVLPQPSISIQSVTQGALTVPVDMANVQGQIEITLNVNAREQAMDSVVVYIDSVGTASTKSISAGRQGFGGIIPPTGEITISVPTHAFTKNYAAGTTKVTHINGPTTIRAALYPKGLTGAPVQVVNCSAGQTVICATPRSINLNNQDGWAADITKPTRSAISNNAPTLGYTYWGGPGAEGLTSVTLYSVIYNTTLANGSPRDVNTLAWSIGQASTGSGCSISNEIGTGATPTTRPWRRTFGYTAGGADLACAYQWTAGFAGDRDNVIVLPGTLDNANTPMPATGLIPNTVYALALPTPDSLRLDYVGPASVTQPQVQGAENFNWVNHNWLFKPSGTLITDNGVGPLASSWTAYATGNGGGSTFPTVIVKGDAPLAETNQNCAGAGCDGYLARATGTDLLGNSSNSAVTSAFGVDRTAPLVRYSELAGFSNYASIYTKGGSASVLDSTTYNAFVGIVGANVTTSGQQNLFLSAAAGVDDSFRIEARDNRSGLSRAVQNTRRFAQGGATGSSTNVSSTTSGAFGVGLADGFRPGPAFHVTNGTSVTPATVGYYTTTGYAVDRAGNVSGCPTTGNINGTTGMLASVCTAAAPSTTAGSNPAVPGASSANLFVRRTLALDPGQPLITGVSPNNAYTANSSQTFTLGSEDDLEVIDARLRIQYPNVTVGDDAGTITLGGGLVWQYETANTVLGYFPSIATRFDNSIINPRLSSLVLDQFTLNVQETCVNNAAPSGWGVAVGPTTAASCVAPKFVGDPINVTGAGSIPVTKPSNVAVRVRDVFGSFVRNTIPGAQTGVSAEFVSPILPATVATGGSYSVTYYNPGVGQSCPAGGVVQAPNTTTCVSGGVNFRHDGGTAGVRNFRAVQPLSVTLPVFNRVELYALNAAGEWVFIQRCTVPASIVPNTGPQSCGAGTVNGTDNGLERYWVYSFNNIPSLPGGAGYWGANPTFRALGVNAAGYGLFSSVQP